MALIAHYKLDGNANDSVGGNHGTASNVTWVDGKLGRAGSFNGSNGKVGPMQLSGLHGDAKHSISLWLYANSLSTARQDPLTIGVASENRYSSIDLYNSGLQWYFYGNDIRANFTVPTNVWFHVCLVYEGGGGTTANKSIYINGVKQTNVSTGGTNYGNSTNIPSPTNMWIGYDGGRNTAFFNGLIDDVRIYDHALSLKEVQELAKAKVLHYTFDDFQEPTENLAYTSGNIDWSIANLTASVTRSTVTTNLVYRVTSGGTAGSFRINFNNTKLVNGKSYNLSYRYKIISGGTTFSMTDWCDTPLYNVVNTHGYSSAYGTRSTYDGTFRFMDFTISANTVVEIWDLQLEEKPYATPFVNGTRTGTVRDCSGQDNDAALALANTPRWTSASRLGAGAYSFPEMKLIALPKTNMGGALTNCSISFWRKRSAAGSWLPFSALAAGGGSYIMATSSGTGAFYHSADIGTTPKIYRNGVLGTTPINDDSWNHYVITGLNLSGWAGLLVNAYQQSVGATWQVRGSLDDVRIYATALTDAQVLELYQTRASLDDKGNFYA